MFIYTNNNKKIVFYYNNNKVFTYKILFLIKFSYNISN